MSLAALLGVLLIAAGAIMLFVGYNKSREASQRIMEAFTGRLSDKTTLYLVGGGVATVVGILILFIGGVR